MQHSATSDEIAAGFASSSGSDLTKKQADGILLSVATERFTSEEIQSLERSPQRSASVRGRRESGSTTVGKTTSPSHVNITVDNSKRSTELRSGSPEKTVRSLSATRSPVLAGSDKRLVTAYQSSVTSHDRHADLPNSASRRSNGHVSDSTARHDRRLQKSVSGGRRSGFVSDTSFSATVDNAATVSVRRTAVEGALVVHLVD